MVESIETVIIGAGQAGLATSYFLKQQGGEHIILDKASRPAEAWRSQRWDSFTFVSPNWTFQLPGGQYDGPNPDGFMPKDEIVGWFDRYVAKYQLPIAFNTCVTSVQPRDGGGFLVQTQEKDYHARNVVAANGWFGNGKIPSFARKIPPSIFQLHSGSYRNPQALPAGAVLVAGSGQSGAQIAEELYQSGRKVFLATGTALHAPRSYRGKDLFRWVLDSGFTDRPYEQMQFFGHPFVAPMVSGKDGGHSLNLHKFYREGVILLGHARDYVEGKLIIAPDLRENLNKADTGQKFIVKYFDDYIQRAGVDAPSGDLPAMTDGYQAPEKTELDVQAEGINTIIWACGYEYGSAIFRMPILNPFGLPDAPHGVSQTYPGLYFAGFYLPSTKSGHLFGVGQCASYVVERIRGKAEDL